MHTVLKRMDQGMVLVRPSFLPSPDPQVEAGADNSDDDLFESEAEVVPEKTARQTVRKVPKKIPRQAGEWKAKKIKV